MYVSPISSRFCVGRLTPAMRATWTQPCLCLCRGFEQMTIVRPCRLITRQRSHIGLTEGRTFIGLPLLHSKGDPAAREVVGRELDLDAVAREDADVVLAHLPGDPSEHAVATVELNPEHRAGQGLDHLAFDLDLLFLDCHFRARTTPFGRWFSSEKRRRKRAVRAAAGHRSTVRFSSTRNPQKRIPVASKTPEARQLRSRSSARSSVPRSSRRASSQTSTLLATPTRGVRILGPPAMIATVCSKCADRDSSAVEIVQPSSQTITSDSPAVIIGSIAIVIPSDRRGPRPGSPKFGMCGSSW